MKMNGKIVHAFVLVHGEREGVRQISFRTRFFADFHQKCMTYSKITFSPRPVLVTQNFYTPSPPPYERERKRERNEIYLTSFPPPMNENESVNDFAIHLHECTTS